jgi:hypothetical protein
MSDGPRLWGLGVEPCDPKIPMWPPGGLGQKLGIRANGSKLFDESKLNFEVTPQVDRTKGGKKAPHLRPCHMSQGIQKAPTSSAPLLRTP